MAQVTISEEHYRELAALAEARSTTPDALADELLDTLLTATDQIAFWGQDIDDRLAAAQREMQQRPPRYQTNEEFLAELHAHMKVSTDADA